MKVSMSGRLLLVALWVVSVVANKTTVAPTGPGGKIVGGIEVSINKFNYQLSLRRNGNHYCGATIIHTLWALTAAHCSGYTTTEMSLRAGSTSRTVGGTIHTIAQKIVHTSYSSNTYDYDIALLKVKNAFVYTATVGRIALPTSTAIIPGGTNSTVSGWGTMNSGATTLPVNLRAVAIPVVSQTSCRSSYGTAGITDRMLCAGLTPGGKDSCQGDSGGPLIVSLSGVKRLIGVVSWGYGCALANYPGVYSSVPNLLGWIKNNTGNVV